MFHQTPDARSSRNHVSSLNPQATVQRILFNKQQVWTKSSFKFPILRTRLRTVPPQFQKCVCKYFAYSRTHFRFCVQVVRVDNTDTRRPASASCRVFSPPRAGTSIEVARELRLPVWLFAVSRATISGTGRRHLYSLTRESNILLRVLLQARHVQTYVPDQSRFGTLRVMYGPTVFQCFQAWATATLPQIPPKNGINPEKTWMQQGLNQWLQGERPAPEPLTHKDLLILRAWFFHLAQLAVSESWLNFQHCGVRTSQADVCRPYLWTWRHQALVFFFFCFFFLK